MDLAAVGVRLVMVRRGVPTCIGFRIERRRRLHVATQLVAAGISNPGRNTALGAHVAHLRNIQHAFNTHHRNDPVEGLDPGGTRSTRPGRRDKQADKQVTHTVTSGDRNPTAVPQRAARPEET